jgi:hypothetical protein
MKLTFFFIIVDIAKLRLHLLIERIWIFNINCKKIGYAIFKYPTATEYHYLRISGRKYLGLRKDKYTYFYDGYLPLWIDKLDKEIYIDKTKFKRLFGSIYYRNSKEINAFFIFDKKGFERIFLGKLNGYGNKWDIRLAIRIL